MSEDQLPKTNPSRTEFVSGRPQSPSAEKSERKTTKWNRAIQAAFVALIGVQVFRFAVPRLPRDPSSWRCIGSGEEIHATCTAGPACALLEREIFCPSSYVDLTDPDTHVNNWKKKSRWPELSGKVAVLAFSAGDRDSEGSSSPTIKRGARVHVSGATRSGDFFGLVKLTGYKEALLGSDDLFVESLELSAQNASSLRRAMNAQKLLDRALSKKGTIADIANFVDAFNAATDDSTRRSFAEVITASGVDFNALVSRREAASVAATAAVARQEQETREARARMTEFDHLAERALTVEQFYERYWTRDARHPRARADVWDANRGRDPENHLWALFAPGTKGCSSDDDLVSDEFNALDLSDPPSPKFTGSEFEIREQQAEWSQTRKNLLAQRSQFASEMKRVTVYFDCVAKDGDKECPIGMPAFDSSGSTRVSYDFEHQGYGMLFEAGPHSPWSLGNGTPKIVGQGVSADISTGKQTIGWLGGQAVEVEGRGTVHATDTRNSSKFVVSYDIDERTAKLKNYGEKTKIRLRLILQLQSAGFNKKCRVERFGEGPKSVYDDGLGLVLGTKLRGYEVYFDTEKIAEVKPND